MLKRNNSFIKHLIINDVINSPGLGLSPNYHYTDILNEASPEYL